LERLHKSMPVTDADLAQFAGSHDIINLGMLGDAARRRLHGRRTTFVRVRHLTADSGAPTARIATAGEVRVDGLPSSRAAAVEQVAWARGVAGDVPLSAFALSDLEQLAAREHVTLRALLEDLRSAGLELVAEAPVDLLQSAHRSIEEVNIAGLALARLTVHQAPSADPIPLLKSVAELQRSVAVIRAFAPLPRAMNPAVPTTGYDDVKRVALARLIVDNVPSIQVDWSLYGPKLAQVALTVGADDIDDVSAADDVGQGRRRAPLEEVRRNIVAAGLDPVERNGRFDLMPS
jgi:CofH/MqnC C-terminal region